MSGTNTETVLRSCSTCHVRERREGQRTCAECHASYQKNYRGRAARALEQRAYRRGFEAFRAAAVARFTAIPQSEMNGLVAAEIVRQILAT